MSLRGSAVSDLSFASLTALGIKISARVASHMDPSSFDPSFYRDNFAGQGSCGGLKQSPIELPGGVTPTLAAERTTVFRMPQAVFGATIENLGAGTQVRRHNGHDGRARSLSSTTPL